MNDDTLNSDEERQIMEAFAARKRRTARAQKANPGSVKPVVSPAEYQARLIREIEEDLKDEEHRKKMRLDKNWNEWRNKIGERFRAADTDEKSINSRIELLRRGTTHRTSVVLSGDMGVGKAQPVSEPVLTPLGFRTMGSIQPGDFVIGSDGHPTQVEEVYPQGERPVYKVALSDESFTYCDIEHLWTVAVESDPETWVTLTTQDMIDSGVFEGKYKLPLVSPVIFDTRTNIINIDPYILGALLASGKMSGDSIILKTEHIETVQKIEEILPDDILLLDSPNEEDSYILVTPDFNSDDNSVIDGLKEYRLWGLDDKDLFIPESYKTAALTDRVNFVNGMLSVQNNEFRDQVEIESTQLRKDFVELVNSLGGVCSIYEEVGKSTIVHVESKPERFIESITYSHDEKTQCIKVAAPDSLYVTRGFILTHNTWLAYAYLNKLVKQGLMSPANLVASTETAVLGRIAAGGFKRAEMYEDLRNPLKKVYFIDDVGQAFFSSDAVRTEVWYELIDHIYANDLTLIITTNKLLGSQKDAPRNQMLSTWLGGAAYDRLKHIMGPEGLIMPSGPNKRPAIYRERDALHKNKISTTDE